MLGQEGRRMSKYGNVEFENEVDKAYQILWKMYKPVGGCNWDIEKEQKLLNMLNTIDNELGR